MSATCVATGPARTFRAGLGLRGGVGLSVRLCSPRAHAASMGTGGAGNGLIVNDQWMSM